MRNVFVASSLADAALIRNLLAQNGIESQAVEKLRGNIGTPYTEVWVLDDADGDRAVQLIKSLHVDAVAADPWSCVKCRETNPASFEICWKCGQEHRADAL